MKGSFVVFGEFDGSPGVQRKVDSQVKALRESGIDCDLLLVARRSGFSARNIVRLFRIAPWDLRLPSEQDPSEFLIMRKPLLTPRVIWRLWRYRQCHPGATVLLECPTYPYDEEIRIGQGKGRALAVDRGLRRLMPFVVDRVVTYSCHDEIFGVETLRTTNGIDVEGIKRKQDRPISEQIHILAVAMFSHWHGYDRLLRGVSDYYREGGERGIVIHFVGEGPSLDGLKEIAQDAELSRRVIFHGILLGDDLDEIFEKSDIAFGSIGLHRIGVPTSSSLKVREYLARGLPVVAGASDVLSEREEEIFLELPSGERAVDMNEIVDFFDRVYGGAESNSSVIEHARRVASEKCDMQTSLQPVVEYLRLMPFGDGIREG